LHLVKKCCRNRLWKAIINGMKRKERKCVQNRLKLQWREA
jgi:hypothetical protein